MFRRCAALPVWSLCVLILVTPAFGGRNPYAGKKLIHYGVCTPDTTDLRVKVADYERVPFDGLVIKIMAPGTVDNGQGSIGWKTFSKTRFQPEQYERAIADLKATRFRRFTDNFIQLLAMPGDVDWFDPEWPAVAHNAACLARVAKRGGCKGICFDPEDYGKCHIWMYSRMPAEWQANHTFEQYVAKVRERGREFIRAINKEYQSITILSFLGPSWTYRDSLRGPLKDSDYGLLGAFFDGMCEAATAETIIVDGYEQSYGFRERRQYLEGRRNILERAKTISKYPKAYTKHMRAGFGMWVDNAVRQVGWNIQDLAKNYYTPAGLRATVSYALEASDGYVWVYTEQSDPWSPTHPMEYNDALALAKLGSGVGEQHPVKVKPKAPKAEDVPGYSDDATFAELRKSMTEILDFPKDGWRFRRDEANEGTRRGWHLPEFDDTAWRDISIGRFWEVQGENYDGRAWYRRRFIGPSVEPGRRVYIAFGAADESARVWLNGRFIGEHNIGEVGWNEPFAMEITRVYKPGERNVLAVQVADRGGAGGLWKSVKLMVK
ncbi:MAG: beta galactosidase jelly roll domain-containing protein [Armatimonadota bacterium]|nr:beta galactosidase jelly roll domain-containing protein [Armatimonadota bacterium]